MKKRFKQVQPAMAFAATHLDQDVSLEALAGEAAMSPFHLHRVFSAVADETRIWPPYPTAITRAARLTAIPK